MFRFLSLMVLALGTLVPPAVQAMGGNDAPAPAARTDSDFTAGKQAVEKKDWARAIESLNKAAVKDARNADIQNYLGYSYRNSGQLELAFKHYEQALSINPRHRGAHEYVGEAYLMVNNVAKAEEHLAALNRLCTAGCEEYSELKEKIAAYKSKTK
jgi:tetratricopeptide (TPR) repeat protein